MIRSPLLLASVLALTLGACATDVAGESADAASAPAPPASVSEAASSPTVAATSASSPAPTSPASVSLTTGDTARYGTVLTDDSGMTLYLFFEDTEGQSMCYDACADNWPPLVVDGQPRAEDGVDQGLVGTLQRDDGAMQVTYDDQPLYLHAGDSEPGDVRGFGYGNAWFPVAPDGTPIEMADTNGDGDAASEY